MSALRTVPVAPGLAALTADKDLLLVDVWGVLHNGLAAHAAAGAALTQFRAAGGTVILVSNAPRASTLVVKLLDGMGVPRSAYDGVVTSGDVARHILAQGTARSLVYIGPERDRALFAGLPVTETPVAQAELVLCTGFEDDEAQTPADYDALLDECRARDLPMICANPDLLVERGAKLIWCAGALADNYAARSGAVIWTGKPHALIYDSAIAMARLTRNADIAPARMMAIGDALRTDVAGARALGIDVLMTADGIHGHDLLGPDRAVDPDKAAAFFAAAPVAPDHVIARLTA